VLVFCEVIPKTIAAHYPEQVAYRVVGAVQVLLRLTRPVVWLLEQLVAGAMKMLRIGMKTRGLDPLNRDELRGLVGAAGRERGSYQDMVLGVLDLANMTVNDVMIPRQDVVGIDLEWPVEQIMQTVQDSGEVEFVVYRRKLDQVLGMLGIHDLVVLLRQQKTLLANHLLPLLTPVYFMPEKVSLEQQLADFRSRRYRCAMIVNEYGEITGQIQLEDIVEEIVGEVSNRVSPALQAIDASVDGGYILPGHLSVRDVNRMLALDLPCDGPNTLSGLMIEAVEDIPRGELSVRIAGYTLTALQVEDKKIARLKIMPEQTVVEGKNESGG